MMVGVRSGEREKKLFLTTSKRKGRAKKYIHSLYMYFLKRYLVPGTCMSYVYLVCTVANVAT